MKNNIHLIDSNNFIRMNTADMPQYGLVRDDVPGPALVRAGPTFSKALKFISNMANLKGGKLLFHASYSLVSACRANPYLSLRQAPPNKT